MAVAKGAAVLSKIGLLTKLNRNDEAIGTVAVNYFARDQRVDVDMADAIVKMHLDVDGVSAHPRWHSFSSLHIAHVWKGRGGYLRGRVRSEGSLKTLLTITTANCGE